MRPTMEYIEVPRRVTATAVGPGQELLEDIPGSQCIGKGYNVFDGDYANGLWTTSPLFDLANKKGMKIDESHTYSVPTNVEFTPYEQGEFKIITGRTIEEHQQNLSLEAGISGNYWGFKASMNASFEKSSFRRSCFQYTSTIDEIARWILKLPADPWDLLLPPVEDNINSLEARELFRQYGTHYLWSIIVGARATYSSATDTTSLESESDLGVIAQMSYKFMAGSVSAEVRAAYADRVAKFDENSSSRVRILGGNSAYAKAIFDGDYGKWVDSTDERPEFVGFAPDGLRPIWELCRDKARRDALQEGYTEYAADRSKPFQRFPLQEGDLIALKTIDNDGIETYWNVQQVGDGEGVVAIAEGIPPSARFKVTAIGPGKIALQAYSGKYLWLDNRANSPTFTLLRADKSFPDRIAIDPSSTFTVTYLEEEGKITLQTLLWASNGSKDYVGLESFDPRKNVHRILPSELEMQCCEFSVYIL